MNIIKDHHTSEQEGSDQHINEGHANAGKRQEFFRKIYLCHEIVVVCKAGDRVVQGCGKEVPENKPGVEKDRVGISGNLNGHDKGEDQRKKHHHT